MSDEDIDHQEAIKSLGDPMTRAKATKIQYALVQFMMKSIAAKEQEGKEPKFVLVIQASVEGEQL